MNPKQKIKALLKEQGLNYRQLAEILEISYPSVNNAMSNKKPLTAWQNLILNCKSIQF